MIPSDIGDDGKDGGDDIGTVQSATKTCFYNSYIHFLLSKIFKGHGYGQFEKRRLNFFRNGFGMLYKINDKFLAYHFAIDLYAFPEIF